MMTRLNVLFIAGNGFLLITEIVSPFFGYWHGVSLLATVLFNLLGTRMLNYYSTRMCNNIYLLKDGKHVEIELMNAFMMNETRKVKISDLGYLQPSRLYNVDSFTNKQEDMFYINVHRNMYVMRPEYSEILMNVLKGKEIKVQPGGNSDAMKHVVKKAMKHKK